MSTSFTDPPIEIADDQAVASATPVGHPHRTSPGRTLGPGEGHDLLQGGIITMKARAHDTDGQFALTEWYGPRDMVAPGTATQPMPRPSTSSSGELDIGVGDTAYHTTPGSYIYVPKDTVHDWRVTSATCRFLVFIISWRLRALLRAARRVGTVADLSIYRAIRN